MTYIKTFNNNKLDYINPTKDMIDIRDIVRALPRLNRFVGHSERAYSVAEHSLYCLMMAKDLGFTPIDQLHVFVHDFSEAYVGDCPAPLKNLIPDFKKVELRVEESIYDYMGIEMLSNEEYDMIVKPIDLTMLALEMREFTKHTWEEFIYPFSYVQFLDNTSYYLSDGLQYDEKYFQKQLLLHYNDLMKQIKGE